MYPAGAPPKADDWTFDTFLKAAEACHKGGHPFGIGLGTTSDNVDTAGAIFHGFGADMVDAKGTITVKTDAVRQALDFYKKLMQFLPPDDRKSTRLNSSHSQISYAVFCLKKQRSSPIPSHFPGSP